MSDQRQRRVDIVAARSAGASYSMISQQFGISRARISQILSDERESRVNVPGLSVDEIRLIFARAELKFATDAAH